MALLDERLGGVSISRMRLVFPLSYVSSFAPAPAPASEVGFFLFSSVIMIGRFAHGARVESLNYCFLFVKRECISG